MAVTKWLHVNYVVGDPWVLPIWGTVNRAERLGHVQPLPDEVRQLGLHVSTHLSMIQTVIQRINVRLPCLIELVAKREPHHEFTTPDNGYVFDLPGDFACEFLVDLDALLFEINSCCELMGCLFKALYAHAGKRLPREPVGLTIRQVLKAAGQDSSWFGRLDLHRNFFTHQGAPYFAIDLSNAHEGLYDLLIMKRNLHSFDDKAQFVRFSELTEIVRGFQNSKPVIQQHLMTLFS